MKIPKNTWRSRLLYVLVVGTLPVWLPLLAASLPVVYVVTGKTIDDMLGF